MELLPLFVETVEDLRVRSSLTSTPYDAIQAAGLMRRLLLDRQAVGPRAGSALRRLDWYSRDASFSWTLMPGFSRDDEDSQAITMGATMDPELWRARFHPWTDDGEFDTLRFSGSHEDLLAAPLIQGRTGSDPTVFIRTRDLVRHFAHAMGGVHHGESRTPPPQLLTATIASDLPQVLWTIRALGRVVVRGYEPLVYATVMRGHHWRTSGGAQPSRPRIQ